MLKYFVIHGKLEDINETIDIYNFTIDQLNNMHILHTVAGCGQIDVCKYLISLGLDVNKPNEFMKTPLHSAARSELDTCKLSLRKWSFN